MNISPACGPAIQPQVPESMKDHPRRADYDSYVSACRRQLVVAATFQAWLDLCEIEEKRKQGLLPYQIIEAHPKGSEYFEYSRAWHDAHYRGWDQAELLGFDEWLAREKKDD